MKHSKFIITILLLVFVLSCKNSFTLETKLEGQYGLKFSQNGNNENERIAIFETNDKQPIKNSVDRHLSVVGMKSRYGWDWETPKVSVMIDSKRIMITKKE